MEDSFIRLVQSKLLRGACLHPEYLPSLLSRASNKAEAQYVKLCYRRYVEHILTSSANSDEDVDKLVNSKIEDMILRLFSRETAISIFNNLDVTYINKYDITIEEYSSMQPFDFYTLGRKRAEERIKIKNEGKKQSV